MYNPWDLEVWDIVYVELRDWDDYVYMVWEWEITTIHDSSSPYPIYIKWLNRKWSTSVKYSEVTMVIEWKSAEETSKKSFYFIRC